MKIKVLSKPFELNIKRCYLPVIIEAVCPICSTITKSDLTDDYLSYPRINANEEIYFVCNNGECANSIDGFGKYVEIGLTVTEVKK